MRRNADDGRQLRAVMLRAWVRKVCTTRRAAAMAVSRNSRRTRGLDAGAADTTDGSRSQNGAVRRNVVAPTMRQRDPRRQICGTDAHNRSRALCKPQCSTGARGTHLNFGIQMPDLSSIMNPPSRTPRERRR